MSQRLKKGHNDKNTVALHKTYKDLLKQSIKKFIYATKIKKKGIMIKKYINDKKSSIMIKKFLISGLKF